MKEGEDYLRGGGGGGRLQSRNFINKILDMRTLYAILRHNEKQRKNWKSIKPTWRKRSGPEHSKFRRKSLGE